MSKSSQKVKEICKKCKGAGMVGEETVCPSCKGSGRK